MNIQVGKLSDYFDGVAIKKLSAVEADATVSHQHEFNATRQILEIFGKPETALTIPALFIYLSDDEMEERKAITLESELTLYDARAKARIERGVMRTEYRLYYPENEVTAQRRENDCLFIAKKKDGKVLVAIVQANSTVLSQLLWLFGIENTEERFQVVGLTSLAQKDLPSGLQELLERLDINFPVCDNYLDEMLHLFGATFPSTREFSAFARSKSNYPHALDGTADEVLLNWYETEMMLYLSFEHKVLELEIAAGLTPETYLTNAKSYLNRRKSRAGISFENQLEEIFTQRNIPHSRTPVTELKARPDFIFPGINQYRDPSYPDTCLYMLGAKTTCKDRWRQVLTEAQRIKRKHLITVEQAISTTQTDEMKAHNLQLVVPQGIMHSYKQSQIGWLINLEQFISLVPKK